MPYNDDSLHYDTEFESFIGELQGTVDKVHYWILCCLVGVIKTEPVCLQR